MQRVLAGGLWGSWSLLSSGVLKHGNGSVSNVRVQSGGVVCRGLFTQGPVEGEEKDAKEASASSAAEREAYRFKIISRLTPGTHIQSRFHKWRVLH